MKYPWTVLDVPSAAVKLLQEVSGKATMTGLSLSPKNSYQEDKLCIFHFCPLSMLGFYLTLTA